MSAASSCSMVGWEFAYKLVENALSQKSDVIMLLIHWELILENNFKCVGLGSEKILSETDKANASDLLPDGWNQYPVYVIRYIKNDFLYVLSGSKSNGTFIVNFLHVQDEIATNIVINIDDTVNDIRGPITKLFANHQELIERIKKELIDTPKPIVLISQSKNRFNFSPSNRCARYGCCSRPFHRMRSNNRRTLRRPRRIFHRSSRHTFASTSRYYTSSSPDNVHSIPVSANRSGSREFRAKPYGRFRRT